MLDRLFCYGTLQSVVVLRAVLGRDLPAARAVLPGYASYRIAGEDFPGLIPAAAHTTEGIVYCGLDRADLAHLDRYEGFLYQRRIVRIRTSDGSLVRAWTYVVRQGYRDRVSRDHWDLAEFEAGLSAGCRRPV